MNNSEEYDATLNVAELGSAEAAAWVHATSECEPGAVLGAGCRVWRFCHIRGGARIGRGVCLGQGCYVGARAVIGDYCRLQNGVNVFDGVELESFVFCGSGVTFTNVLAPRVEFPQRDTYLATVVKRGASLGANCTIVPGITIGSYALIAAGSVVTQAVPDFALVVGNPARLQGWRSRSGKALMFDADGFVHCDGDCYKITDGMRVELLDAAPDFSNGVGPPIDR